MEAGIIDADHVQIVGMLVGTAVLVITLAVRILLSSRPSDELNWSAGFQQQRTSPVVAVSVGGVVSPSDCG